DGAERADLRVRDVQVGAVGGNAARLRQRRLHQWAVDAPFAAGPGVGADLLVLEVHGPDLVRSSHGDVQDAFFEYEVPRRAEIDFAGRAGPVVPEGLGAGAGDGGDGPRPQIESPKQVVFGVRHVEQVAVHCHALGVIKSGDGEGAVGGAELARAGDVEYVPGFARHQNTVVIGVGDEQPVPLRVGQHFSRK